MKTISIDQLRDNLDEYLAEAAHDDVVVTHEGIPWVVLKPASQHGSAEVDPLSHSAEFWGMIRERRQEASIPWDEAKVSLTRE